MTYKESLACIHSFGRLSPDPEANLASLRALCASAGGAARLPNAVHIAGTNGKGSVAAMTASILRKAGYKTGKYISPYITRFNERVSIDGADISDDELAALTAEAAELYKSAGAPPLTQFAFVTLLAFMHYKIMKCEFNVIECGMGGRRDPTNALSASAASVITEISLDHTELLGDTVEEIAADKADIIKEGGLCVVYPLMAPGAKAVVERAARERSCRLITPDLSALSNIKLEVGSTEFAYKGERYALELSGEHQVYNALCAVETALALHEAGVLEVNAPSSGGIHGVIRAGLAEARNPARFEVLSRRPLVIFDGAHNASGVAALERTARSLLAGRRLILVCGMLEDKKPEEALRSICALAGRVIFVPVDSPRAVPPGELCRRLSPYCRKAGYNSDLGAALEEARAWAGEGGAALCFGSLYLAAPVKEYFKERES